MIALTNTCPACGALPLADCNSVVKGVQTGWDHDARILEPIVAEIRTTPTPEAHAADAGGVA